MEEVLRAAAAAAGADDSPCCLTRDEERQLYAAARAAGRWGAIRAALLRRADADVCLRLRRLWTPQLRRRRARV